MEGKRLPLELTINGDKGLEAARSPAHASVLTREITTVAVPAAQ